MRTGDSKDGSAQLVTTSPENMGFDHGAHACPGRLFAPQELKMVLIDLLFSYDFE